MLARMRRWDVTLSDSPEGWNATLSESPVSISELAKAIKNNLLAFFRRWHLWQRRRERRRIEARQAEAARRRWEVEQAVRGRRLALSLGSAITAASQRTRLNIHNVWLAPGTTDMQMRNYLLLNPRFAAGGGISSTAKDRDNKLLSFTSNQFFSERS